MTSLNIETQHLIAESNVSAPCSAPKIEKIVPKTEHKHLNKEALVSWLFLIGSLIFVLDGILENVHGVSFSSVLHLTASILFTIGSVLFIPNDSEN